MNEIAEMMKDLREDRDLKQVDVAKVIGTTQQYYSKYETGVYALPLRAAVLLADFYGVSVDYLTGRTTCREGVEGLNKRLTSDCTSGKLISDVLCLKEASRRAVIEYVQLQKLKEAAKKK
ncbi:MAG: helix-turn-helix transcriptional regulator [Clostridia bacterium]